jgi:hypothetical protein
MDVSFNLTDRQFFVVMLLFGAVVFASVLFVGRVVRREQLESMRKRLLAVFHLPDDASHNEAICRYLRLVFRGQFIGVWAGGILAIVVVMVADSRYAAVRTGRYAYEQPRDVAQLGMLFALLYTASLFGSAIGAATAMRVGGVHRARASLGTRDVSTYVPRVCITATFILGPLAAIGALVSLLVGSPDGYERIFLAVAFGVAIVAMVVMIPLANRLAQMRMPVDADRDPVLDEGLRHVSTRLVAGNAMLMVATALAVVAALLMPTYQSAFVVLLALTLPTAYVAQVLSPGERVPKYLLRWLDAPQPSGTV